MMYVFMWSGASQCRPCRSSKTGQGHILRRSHICRPCSAYSSMKRLSHVLYKLSHVLVRSNMASCRYMCVYKPQTPIRAGAVGLARNGCGWPTGPPPPLPPGARKPPAGPGIMQWCSRRLQGADESCSWDKSQRQGSWSGPAGAALLAADAQPGGAAACAQPCFCCCSRLPRP